MYIQRDFQCQCWDTCGIRSSKLPCVDCLKTPTHIHIHIHIHTHTHTQKLRKAHIKVLLDRNTIEYLILWCRIYFLSFFVNKTAPVYGMVVYYLQIYIHTHTHRVVVVQSCCQSFRRCYVSLRFWDSVMFLRIGTVKFVVNSALRKGKRAGYLQLTPSPYVSNAILSK